MHYNTHQYTGKKSFEDFNTRQFIIINIIYRKQCTVFLLTDGNKLY